MNYPKVSIIILNWNGLKYTIECLESLKKITYPNYEVIVVDNGSKGNDADVLEEKYKDYIKLIRNKENLGFAKGNNVAIRKVIEEGKSEYVLLLNNDTEIIQRGWLDKLVKISESEKNIGIVGCTLLFPSGRFQVGGTILKPPFHINISDKVKNVIEVDLVRGACFLIKKKVVDKIGLLDENFYPVLSEESDYCMRAKKAGFKVIYAPEVRIIHHCSVSIKRLRGLDYIGKKNHVRFIFLNYPLHWIILRFLYDFGICFIERKDKDKKISLRNLKIRKNWKNLIGIFLKAYWDNLKGLKEISSKRKNRTQKIWL